MPFMQAQTEMPPPIGLAASTSMFGAFSILLWLIVMAVIPWLRDAFDISPIIGWYVSGTALLLVPMLIVGCLMAWRELPKRDLVSLRKRLRLNTMNRGDVIWATGGLFAIATTTAAILALARYFDPSFRPSPWFLLQPHGWHASVVAAWIPLFVTNILGEELCWRGYLLPRQEAGFGRIAWLLNGILWCLFHWSFGWPIMVTLLPVTLLLPWIVQRRQNTSVGIIIHGAFNAAGFIAAISGAGT
ncbi:CPBP family intramembrane glutamic endopeptidase [Bradyrhizobium australiense]|uniref:CPBP family intramembrane metalloprotease n=1 Tax=Bradyrhizobium australiense TaxID=2721161 RepID=A0A7Y4LTK1_9BRAD|nr:CPBP family intramembrane glutamic endopeptidase [Bradyrhizobium australiense]NOJ38327.1 CPBP family intramembrane metalloprotease [Bradyrhizobium australiense]